MAALKYTVKYYGVYTWLIVRLSAISIVFYIVYLLNFFLCSHDLSYIDWYNFFYNKITIAFNLIVLLFILIHIWIGMKHILEDYIPSFLFRRIGMGLTCVILYIYLLLGIVVIWDL